ncbi:hypothetical protein [Actinospongicola halichondriae]|uniref:hypothetical protein n=1 Tax=Actinospongicola halichondriae TaxID=3236844 RepID=UPI003D557FB4
MVSRGGALLLGALLFLAACGSASLDAGDVDQVVRGAFDDAGVDVGDIDVASAPIDGSWPVSVQVEGDRLELVVDQTAGRITSIDFGTGTVLDQATLESIAGFDDNPAADRQDRRRTAIVIVGFFALVGLGLGVARRLRLREEAALAEG